LKDKKISGAILFDAEGAVSKDAEQQLSQIFRQK